MILPLPYSSSLEYLFAKLVGLDSLYFKDNFMEANFKSKL